MNHDLDCTTKRYWFKGTGSTTVDLPGFHLTPVIYCCRATLEALGRASLVSRRGGVSGSCKKWSSSFQDRVNHPKVLEDLFWAAEKSKFSKTMKNIIAILLTSKNSSKYTVSLGLFCGSFEPQITKIMIGVAWSPQCSLMSFWGWNMLNRKLPLARAIEYRDPHGSRIGFKWPNCVGFLPWKDAKSNTWHYRHKSLFLSFEMCVPKCPKMYQNHPKSGYLTPPA